MTEFLGVGRQGDTCYGIASACPRTHCHRSVCSVEHSRGVALDSGRDHHYPERERKWTVDAVLALEEQLLGQKEM